MRYDVFNGDHIGTVEWRPPGEVVVEVDDADHRAWLERYFRGYGVVIASAGVVRHLGLEHRLRSERAFDEAVRLLAGYCCRPTMAPKEPRPSTTRAAVESMTVCRGTDFAFGGMGA